MRIVIASDIHGSAFYCEKLVRAIRSENAETLLLLGDTLDGENYDDVAEMLNDLCAEIRILSVRGNCDSEWDQRLLQFPIMSEYSWLILNNRMIFATHGHDKLLKPKLLPGDIFLQGHTHVPSWEYRDGRYYFNPGSVSLPRRGSKNSYMLLNDDGFAWKDLSGNIYNTFHMPSSLSL